MSKYVELVNWHATRRHYSTQAHVEALGSRAEGRIRGLCWKVWNCRTVEGDKIRRARVSLPPRDYANLPLCEFCERLATP